MVTVMTATVMTATVMMATRVGEISAFVGEGKPPFAPLLVPIIPIWKDVLVPEREGVFIIIPTTPPVLVSDFDPPSIPLGVIEGFLHHNKGSFLTLVHLMVFQAFLDLVDVPDLVWAKVGPSRC